MRLSKINMAIQLKLIAACCENMGIGKNNDLPWRLKGEMAYFTKMTSETQDNSKKNVVILGKKSWDCIPAKYKPLEGRINFVLTSAKKLDLSKYKDSYVFNSWEQIINKLKDTEFQKEYEEVWVCGGGKIYEDAMNSNYFYRLYLTRIRKNFDCDTFFPKLVDNIKKVSDPRVPQGIQEENGIQWEVEVWENTKPQ